MVFLTTLLEYCGHPIARQTPLYLSGKRAVTQRLVLEELVRGVTLVFPICVFIAQCTKRFAVKCRPPFIRSSLWSGTIMAIMSDMFFELLLPSLRCIPFSWKGDELSTTWLWMLRVWGFQCARPLDSGLLFRIDGALSLLAIRLFFIWLGVHLGECFLPVALTGSIATGKSAVAEMLLDHSGATKNRNGNGKQRKRRRSSKESIAERGKRLFWQIASAFALDPEPDTEGTFTIIDTDSISHEILLPPNVLAMGKDDGVSYSISPNDSVYPQILDAFGDEDTDHKNILDENSLIDRRKLGAIIFQDPRQRRTLNAICHRKIILVMLKNILYESYFGKQNVVCADVPLLFESGLLKWLFGLTIAVACDSDLQFRRLRRRNPDLTVQQCRERIASQIPVEKKAELADIVIWNNGNLEELSKEVEKARSDVVGRLYGMDTTMSRCLMFGGAALLLGLKLRPN